MGVVAVDHLPALRFFPQGTPQRTSPNQQGWFFIFFLPQMHGFSTR